MAEEFDSTGRHLPTPFPTTIYQAPPLTTGDRAIVISCLAAYVGEEDQPVSLILQASNAAGTVVRELARRNFIGPGMSVEMLPTRVVLSAGERLRAVASVGGLLDVTTSVLASAPPSSRRGVPTVEFYVRFLPPDAVGSDVNRVEVSAPVVATVTFPAPTLRIGEAINVPPIQVTCQFPEISGPVVPYEANVPVLPVTVDFAVPASVPTLLPPWTLDSVSTAMWLNAKDAGTFTLANDAVTQWRDRSGNSRHVNDVSQTWGVNTRPLYQASTVNGLPGVRFRGENAQGPADANRLQFSQLAFMKGTNLTIVVIHALYSLNNSRKLIGSFSNGISLGYDGFNAQFYWPFLLPGNNFSNANASAFPNGTSSYSNPPGFDIMIATLSSTEGARIYRNGILLGQSNNTNLYDSGNQLGNFSLEQTFIGGSPGSNYQDPFDGVISEVAVLATAADTDLRQRIEGNAAYEWEFRPRLPINHPYRFQRPVIGA